MGRAPCCSKLGLNRGPWTAEEDALLAKHIEAHGEGCWKGLPKVAGLLRCGKSCRLRWVNYLRPSLKRGNISEDEEDLIITLHSLLGNRWSLIAARIPGRTDNEIKNYWNTHLSKKLTRRGIDPKTHKLLKTSVSKSAKADHNFRQPLNTLDVIHTEKAPNTESRNESSQSGLAYLGSHYDRIEETINTAIPIISDNEGELSREASSIKLDLELGKKGEEVSSSYRSPGRSNFSKEQKSFDSVTNYDSIPSLSSSPLDNLQTVQSDRDNIRDYQHFEESVSIRTASFSDSFAYLGPPSSLVHNFSKTSPKCTSPSSDQSTTSISHTAIATVSGLQIMPLQLVENDTNISEYRTQLSVRELSSLEEKNSTIMLPTSFEVDKDSYDQIEILSDIEIPVFPEDSAHARTIHPEQDFCSEERMQREIWKCVDKLATVEYLEAVDQPFEQSDFWDVSGCNANYLDFQENLANFEWRHFDFLKYCEEEASFTAYQS